MEPPSSMELKLMSCNGLAAFNFFQKLCTYVTVSIVSQDPKEKQKKRNHQKQKTPVDREGDGDPEWKHDVRFDLKQILSSSALTTSLDHMFIHFDILAEGFLGDRSIGQVVVPLRELIHEFHGGGAMRFISYQVRGSDGKPNGTLNFSYKVFGNEIPASTFHIPAIVYPPAPVVAPPTPVAYPPVDNYPSPPMFNLPPIQVQHQPHHHHNPSTSSEIFYTAPPTPASPHTPTMADMFMHPPPQQHQQPFYYQPPPVPLQAPAFPYGYGSEGFGYPHQPGYPMTTMGYPHPNPYPYVDRPYGDTWHRENQHGGGGGGSPGGSLRRIR
ncbi:hypothetical protein MKW94_021469 [Papaver nudicaule]|uniref:C2 domain-containing protein n=1 Tax=Papaver nudicaule TaxID=74823 RepID=A0AA41UY01_PAPNU|nr:hypothetical protein [Papaver nudicaule]